MSEEDERRLLARIGDSEGPALDARRVYADWCEEQGRGAQAELLRLACQLEGQLVPDAASERRLRDLPAPELPCARESPTWLSSDAAQQGVPRELTVFGDLAMLPGDWLDELRAQLQALPSVTRVQLWLEPEAGGEGGVWWDPALEDLLALPQLRALRIARVAPDLRLADAISAAGTLRELSLPAVDDPAWIRAAASLTSLRGFDLSLVPAQAPEDLVVLLERLELESLALSVSQLDRAGERALAGQRRLRRLELEGLRIGWGRSRAVNAVAGLPELESLSLSVGSRRPARRLLAPLAGCDGLRTLGCWVPSGSPGPIPACVERLRLYGPHALPRLPAGLRWLQTRWPLGSLDGVEEAPDLEHLELETESLAADELGRLADHAALRSLTIDGPLDAALLEAIGRLTQLEALELRGQSPDLDFAPLRALGRLQRLETTPWNAPPAALRQLANLPCGDELQVRAEVYEHLLSA